MITFSPMDYREKIPVQFDFTDYLGLETILTNTLTATTILGEDMTSTILDGSSILVSPIVTQYISGVDSGATYIITCEITTATRELILSGKLPVDTL